MKEKYLEIFERDIISYAKSMKVNVSIDWIPNLEDHVIVTLETNERKLSHIGEHSNLRNTVIASITDLSPKFGLRSLPLN